MHYQTATNAWLLQGKLPFKAKDQNGLCKAIIKGSFDPLPDFTSAECRDLIRRMLTVSAVSNGTLLCVVSSWALQ